MRRLLPSQLQNIMYNQIIAENRHMILMEKEIDDEEVELDHELDEEDRDDDEENN